MCVFYERKWSSMRDVWCERAQMCEGGRCGMRRGGEVVVFFVRSLLFRSKVGSCVRVITERTRAYTHMLINFAVTMCASVWANAQMLKKSKLYNRYYIVCAFFWLALLLSLPICVSMCVYCIALIVCVCSRVVFMHARTIKPAPPMRCVVYKYNCTRRHGRYCFGEISNTHKHFAGGIFADG